MKHKDKRGPAAPSKKVVRYILLISGSGEHKALIPVSWRIVVHDSCVSAVEVAMNQGKAVTAKDVKDWFASYAKSWPKPVDSDALFAFVDALNILRVTHSRSIKEGRTAGEARSGLPVVQ